MNFLPGRVTAQGAELFFSDESMSLRLPHNCAGQVQDRVGVAEPLGERMDLYLTTATQAKIISRVSAQRGLQDGASLRLSIDMARAHLFAPGEMGQNLLLGQEQPVSPTSEVMADKVTN
jgi:hypothetical protein